MPKTKKLKCYIVQQVSWNYNDEWYYREDGDGTENSPNFHRPVKVFRSRENAEAFAHEKDVAARKGWGGNPFSFCESLDQMTTLSTEEFWERVQALGVPRPSAQPGGYWFGYDWWERAKLKPEVANAIWDLFDRVRFFEVIEIELPLEV
jgi:hypothetical protein